MSEVLYVTAEEFDAAAKGHKFSISVEWGNAWIEDAEGNRTIYYVEDPWETTLVEPVNLYGYKYNRSNGTEGVFYHTEEITLIATAKASDPADGMEYVIAWGTDRFQVDRKAKAYIINPHTESLQANYTVYNVANRYVADANYKP